MNIQLTYRRTGRLAMHIVKVPQGQVTNMLMLMVGHKGV